MSGWIADAENGLARAIYEHNATRLRAILHPGFLFVGLRSAGLKGWNREEFITAACRFDYEVLTHPIRDQQVLGAVAVVTVDGDWKAFMNGRMLEEKLLMTDVWTKDQAGVWKLLRRHSNRYVAGAQPGEMKDAALLELD